MSYLASFRTGWQNENLAKFILSKFSFVAHPSTVSDDIGSDFFCTLFDVQTEDGHDYLIPKNSFAIQIKSNSDTFEVTNKLEYLSQLEIPFFVGVIDSTNLNLTIYSGEHIPPLFSYSWPNKLEIELCDTVNPEVGYTETEGRCFILKFPKVMVVGPQSVREELSEKVKILSNVCSDMLRNIASRKSDEYVFGFKSNQHPDREMVRVFTGSGSAKVFRTNFLKRLAEVFFNLDWICNKLPGEFDEQEFRIYEDFFNQLKAKAQYSGHYLLGLVQQGRDSLRSRIT